MRSAPPSPLSDNSSRSEWFRQSVLFWSSQADGNTEDDDFRVKSAQSFSSSQLSVDSEEASSEECAALDDNDGGVVLDTSELLRQVEEFENCFKTADSSVEINEMSDDTYSPHMTLEFPNGSLIKNNPLYKKAEDNHRQEYNRCKNINYAKKSVHNNITDKNLLLIKKNKTKKDDDISIVDGQTKNLRTEKRLVDSIQMVQDTLLELSEEIHTSREKRNNHDDRDPNDVMRSLLLQIKPPEDIEGDENTEVDLDEFEDSNEFQLKSEVLLQQIDELIELEHRSSHRPFSKFPISKKKNAMKDQRERIDSGLHSTSSASTSPYPSPTSKRSTCQKYLLHDPTHNNIRRSSHSSQFKTLKEHSDFVFHDDNDFNSDWSPISTLESVESSDVRVRSSSVPFPNTHQDFNVKNPDVRMSTDHMDDNILRNSNLYSESELHAIRKFLTLTSQYFEKENGKVDIAASMEELSLLPSIKESIERQRKELNEQRLKQEEFLHQMGDMLLEIVTLKEEHSTVRTKQAKALSLLKKQLDLVKKGHLRDHSDVVNKVKGLHDKLNCSLSFSDEHLAQSNPSSPKIVPSQASFTRLKSHTNCGEIIWKISDVMKRLTRIKAGLSDSALVSQPFQTNEYGYRMNGWLYLNGRGKMMGKYISLYVCILVGEYDAILSWPIRPTYKFSLIDQKSDVIKKHDHVRVRRVIDIAGKGANIISQKGGIPRPNDSTKALIVGFDDFIAHEQLLERRYLADDVLFLKIEADVS